METATSSTHHKDHFDKDLEKTMPYQGCFYHNEMLWNQVGQCVVYLQYQSAFFNVYLPASGKAQVENTVK